MKDYSNHYPSSKQLIYENGKSLFLKQLNGFEGFDVLIDGNSYKVIIQQHTSPMNEQKEDRLLLCLDDVQIHRGSLVLHEENDWLVTTDVDFNGIYKSCKIQKTNNILTFLNSSQVPTTIPCIISNLTLYSDGLSTDKVTTLPDGKRSVVVSYTLETCKLKIDQRFIFNHSEYSIFKITHIDDFSMVGLLIFTMTQEQKQDGDNLETNLAENGSESSEVVKQLWHI